MSTVGLKKVTRCYGKVVAVDAVDLEISNGEFVVLLGPSGCGKTTLLNMVAGLDEPTSGSILLDGVSIENLPPEKRNIAMVFQSIALYPNKTVFENIAFPLRMSKVSRLITEKRVRATADLLGLGELLNRMPYELSGGQRQRVALGRAAVRNPSVFLFDEPLSALDANLRSEMRIEIKNLHERLGATFIYVTHDQIEALTMADRIALMHSGRLRQVGTVNDLYKMPSDTAVARFVGSPGMNIITGRTVEESGKWKFKADGLSIFLEGAAAVIARSYQGEIMLGVRPEELMCGQEGVLITGDLRVAGVEPFGSGTFVDIRFGAASSMLRLRTGSDSHVKVGDAIALSIKTGDIYLFDHNGARIFPPTTRK